MDLTTLLFIINIIGIALGVGGATISAAVFFRFIKDQKINADEFGTLQVVSKITLIGLCIFLFSGAGIIIHSLMSTGSVPMLLAPLFQARTIIAIFIFINVLVFHRFIIPFLKSNVNTPWDNEGILSRLPLFSVSGGVSIISWYSALILMFVRGVDLPLLLVLNIYGILVTVTILAGYFALNKQIRI